MTIDAMGTHPVIAAQIIDQGGDSILALKRNQEDLYQEVVETFEMALTSSTSGISPHRYERG